MNVEGAIVAVLLILGLVMLRLIWPWGRTKDAADWRALYESAMSENNADILRTVIFKAEKAVQSRKKELRNDPESPERTELAVAKACLIRLKAEKLRWPVTRSG